MQKNLPAVGAPLDAPVRPRAWAWKDEPSGIEVYSGWDEPRPTNGSEPLYDQAAIDAAVAAERERCAKLCEARSLDLRRLEMSRQAIACDYCARAIRDLD